MSRGRDREVADVVTKLIFELNKGWVGAFTETKDWAWDSRNVRLVRICLPNGMDEFVAHIARMLDVTIDVAESRMIQSMMATGAELFRELYKYDGGIPAVASKAEELRVRLAELWDVEEEKEDVDGQGPF